LFAVLISNGAFILTNFLVIAFGSHSLISNSLLVVNGLACFLLMVTYRILVKYFFLYIKNLKLDKKRVIIYGAGEAGVATKRTFDHDYKVNKNIIAFIDDDQRKVGKTIDGM
jgi:FlaA1/EpsC-like NDP-sugar epimerase